MRRCTQCVITDRYPGISFDRAGVCSLCREHEDDPYPLGEDRLPELLHPFRNHQTPYEAVVALSGGRDSTFTAWYAVRVLGLRILTVTVDNGFMPETTRDNIRRTADLLGVEHRMIRHDRVQRQFPGIFRHWHKHKHPDPALIALFCTGCVTGYRQHLERVVRQLGIPLVLQGSGEPADSFAEILLKRAGAGSGRVALVTGLLSRLSRNPGLAFSQSFLGAAWREFRYRFTRRKPAFTEIELFQFVPWSEQRIVTTIQNELDWRMPPHATTTWRSDCFIHTLKEYYYLKTLGFTKNDDLRGHMIRHGLISREQSLELLQEENSYTREKMQRVMHALGLPESLL